MLKVVVFGSGVWNLDAFGASGEHVTIGLGSIYTTAIRTLSLAISIVLVQPHRCL